MLTDLVFLCLCVCVFCRFEGIGIYVVMFIEILKTLFRVVLLFFYLMFAFSLAFYALMLNQVGREGWRLLLVLEYHCTLSN